MTAPSSKLPNLTTDTEEFISTVEAASDTPLYKMTPEGARNVLKELQKNYHTETEAETFDVNIFTPTAGNIELTVVSPKGKNEKLPVILYAHGGGWVMGDNFTHETLIRKLAVCTNSVVVFPNYTHAPEAKYPVQINQIYGALRYIYDNPNDFNIDENKIVIAGDSAGGNMATVAAIMAKKEKGPKILLQVLLYPVTNVDMDTQSYHDFKDGPWLTKPAMEWFFEQYLPEHHQKDDTYISPLKADFEELKDLPPALIITNENDVLRDEGEAYALKLDAAGVKTTSIRLNGTIHDCMMIDALQNTAPVKAAFLITCEIIKKACK